MKMDEWDLGDCLNYLNDVRYWTACALHHGGKKEIPLMIDYIERINTSFAEVLAVSVNLLNDQDD